MTADTAPLAHGGNLAQAEARFGRPAAGWLDLSTGINPDPYPLPALEDHHWRRLPEAAETAELARLAGVYFGVPAAARVVPTPGTQAAIQALPRLRPPGHVAVVSPTYGEHAHCWRQAGHRVREVAADAVPGDADVVVVVNPNNPDGAVADPADLQDLARGQAARGGWLVVDEAFADTVPEASVAGAADRDGLIVLRSFGKFFGLAGLRLGFAVSAPGPAQHLSAALGPWAVSGPAVAVGRRAYADSGWIDATRRRLTDRRRALDRVLAASGLEVVGGTDLFRLLRRSEERRVGKECRSRWSPYH